MHYLGLPYIPGENAGIKFNVGNRGCLHRGSLMYAGGGGQKKCLK